MKGSARRKLDQLNFMEQVRECRDNGYLLSSRKMGSGAFSKVYLAYATHERLRHNPKLASDLRGKRHVMVAIKIISTAEAPVEFSQKFLPREISSLNTTYKHLNVVQLYETYQNSRRSYLVLELAARGDLLEHINSVSDHRCRPGLEEDEARGLFWQLVSTVAHCHSSGIVHRDLKCENILLDDQGLLKLSDFGFANRSGLKNSLLSTFCGSVAYTAPEILMSKMYNGEQADLCSLGIILYAKVTGKLPFKERQLHRMLHLMHQGPTFRPGMSPECQDLIRGLLQLRPRARLDLQQVAAHCWMLPIAHALFLTMLSSSPGVVGPPLPLLTCHGCWLQRNQPSPSCQQPLTTWSLAETHSLRGCSSNSSVPSTGDLTTRVLLAQCPSAQTQSQEEVQSAQLGLQSTVAASVGVGASW